MTTLKERIQLAIDKSGVRKTDLAKAIGLSPAAISEWTSGDTKSIKASNLLKAAHYLNVNPDWLNAGRGSMKPLSSNGDKSPLSSAYGFHVNSVTLIPLKDLENLITRRRMGTFDPSNYESVHTTVSTDDLTFAFRAQGDSMEPEFPQGSIIVAQYGAAYKNHDYVIAAAEGQMIFSQYVLLGDKEFLKPSNARYPLMDLGESKIVATCLETIRKLK